MIQSLYDPHIYDIEIFFVWHNLWKIDLGNPQYSSKYSLKYESTWEQRIQHLYPKSLIHRWLGNPCWSLLQPIVSTNCSGNHHPSSKLHEWTQIPAVSLGERGLRFRNVAWNCVGQERNRNAMSPIYSTPNGWFGLLTLQDQIQQVNGITFLQILSCVLPCKNNTNNLSYWSVVSRMGGSSCTRPVVARVFFNNVYHIQNSRYRCIVSTLRSNPIGKEWQHLFGFWKTVVRSPLKLPSAFRLQIRSKRFLWASSEIASSPCCGISFSFGDWRALRFVSSISKLWLRPTSCEFSSCNFSIWALKDSTSSPSPGHWPVPAWTGASLAAAGSWLSCGGTGYRKNWHLAGDFVKQVGQLYIY